MGAQLRIAFEPEPQPNGLQEFVPGRCPHETMVAHMSENSTKSRCDLTTPKIGHPVWTNCRDWGACTRSNP